MAKLYYAGNEVSVALQENNGDVHVLDIHSIEWTEQSDSTPAFNHSSRDPQAYMQGNLAIQGNLILNHHSSIPQPYGKTVTVATIDGSYSSDLLDSDPRTLNVQLRHAMAASDTSIMYFNITDVHFQSTQIASSPDGQPTQLQIQFIAKQLTYIPPQGLQPRSIQQFTSVMDFLRNSVELQRVYKVLKVLQLSDIPDAWSNFMTYLRNKDIELQDLKPLQDAINLDIEKELAKYATFADVTEPDEPDNDYDIIPPDVPAIPEVESAQTPPPVVATPDRIPGDDGSLEAMLAEEELRDEHGVPVAWNEEGEAVAWDTNGDGEGDLEAIDRYDRVPLTTKVLLLLQQLKSKVTHWKPKTVEVLEDFSQSSQTPEADSFVVVVEDTSKSGEEAETDPAKPEVYLATVTPNNTTMAKLEIDWIELEAELQLPPPDEVAIASSTYNPFEDPEVLRYLNMFELQIANYPSGAQLVIQLAARRVKAEAVEVGASDIYVISSTTESIFVPALDAIASNLSDLLLEHKLYIYDIATAQNDTEQGFITEDQRFERVAHLQSMVDSIESNVIPYYRSYLDGLWNAALLDNKAGTYISDGYTRPTGGVTNDVNEIAVILFTAYTVGLELPSYKVDPLT